jgi:hypothetical protein
MRAPIALGAITSFLARFPLSEWPTVHPQVMGHLPQPPGQGEDARPGSNQYVRSFVADGLFR